MIVDKIKIPAKIISLILSQVFLVTSLAYPEIAPRHNKDLVYGANNIISRINIASMLNNKSSLRKPLNSETGYYREAEAMTFAAQEKLGSNSGLNRFLRNGLLTIGLVSLSFLSPAPLEAGLKLVRTGGAGVINEKEIHQELKVETVAKQKAVMQLFYSFPEYQDTVLYNPKVGYYTTGKVDFKAHFETYPILLSPYFGQMFAEHAFQTWLGMRKAGTLGPDENFTIAEFGAGTGDLALDFLNFVETQARVNPDMLWKEFFNQLVYVCYDRSPILRKEQEEKNAKFKFMQKFKALEGDARNPAKLIEPGSITGMVLSNELPDAFSVYKVRLTHKGAAEAAFVMPWITPGWLGYIRLKGLPAATKALILKQNEEVRQQGISDKPNRIYLTKKSFEELLNFLAKLPRVQYQQCIKGLKFNETYIPARLIPELAEHFKKHAEEYAIGLAKAKNGMVYYVNLGESQYIQGAGRILRAGYVFTVDYGSNWAEQLKYEYVGLGHLRTYGPGNKGRNDPYDNPTGFDITADVNFSHMAQAGLETGLIPKFFGHQRSLLSGTSVTLDGFKNAGPSATNAFSAFIGEVYFRLLVQQKQGTDPKYQYPDNNNEPLEFNRDALSQEEREQTGRIKSYLLNDLGFTATFILPFGGTQPILILPQAGQFTIRSLSLSKETASSL